MEKTNVIRLLEQAGIPCRAASYAFDENDLNGLHAAEGIGMPAAQVFKTLVARGEKQGQLVFCIRLRSRRMQPCRNEEEIPNLSGGNRPAL